MITSSTLLLLPCLADLRENKTVGRAVDDDVLVVYYYVCIGG